LNNVRDVIDKDHFDEVDKEDSKREREGRVVEAVNGLPLPPLVHVHWAQENGNAAHEDLMKKGFIVFLNNNSLLNSKSIPYFLEFLLNRQKHGQYSHH
jgi:hypothetical protein